MHFCPASVFYASATQRWRDMRTRKYIDLGVITLQFPCAIPVIIYCYAKCVSIAIATENYKVWDLWQQGVQTSY